MSSDGEGRAAHEVYTATVSQPPALKRAMRFVTTFALGAATAGAGVTNPGGRQVVIFDRVSGEPLAEVSEGWADEQVALVNAVQNDLESLSAAEFARRWIEGTTR